MAPDDLVDIHSFLRNGRYLGITNYVWYTSLLLFLGGGYILSVQKDSTKKQKIFNLVILAVLFTASFLSGSRSSMLVFPFVAVLFYGGKKTIRNVILALGVLYLLYLFIMYSNLSLRIIDKFQILINKVKEGAIIDDTRNQLREVAIADFKSNWLFGIGWYEFRYHTHSLFNKYLHTHNLYLQLIAENGIFGTIIITLPWLATYIKAVSYFFKYRNYSENKTYKIVKYFLMILTLLFIDSFVHVTLFDPRTMLIFYIICGVVMQLTKTAPDPNPIPDNQLTEVRG
ncbi:MAG: O-antigen ligase family protein [Clostridiales bacterium]|nr:O-antigen ligase family protein [Clostridiales bacterium]